MASLVYNRLKYNLMTGAVNLATDTIKVALMATGHSASTVADNIWSQVSANEMTGTGYTSGGVTLTGQTVTQGLLTSWDATDISWTSASFTAFYAVIYDSTATLNLICSIDFGTANGLTVSSGTFAIRWNTHGIMTLQHA